MAQRRRPIRLWEVMLPAGLRLVVANLLVEMVTFWVRLGFPGRTVKVAVLRLSMRLSRAGLHSWRFWGAKWR